MNEKGEKLPLRSLAQGIIIFLATLFLVHYLGLELTHAEASSQGKRNGIYPNTVIQDDADMLANCRYGITAGSYVSHIMPTLGAGVFYKFGPDWKEPAARKQSRIIAYD